MSLKLTFEAASGHSARVVEALLALASVLVQHEAVAWVGHALWTQQTEGVTYTRWHVIVLKHAARSFHSRRPGAGSRLTTMGAWPLLS